MSCTHIRTHIVSGFPVVKPRKFDNAGNQSISIAHVNSVASNLKALPGALVVGLLLASIIKWSLLVPPVNFTRAGCLACLQLLGAAVIFTVIGNCALRKFLRFSREEFRGDSRSFVAGLSGCFISLISGQLVSVIWLSFRSGLSLIFERVCGFALPVTALEVAALVLLCLFDLFFHVRSSIGAPRARISSVIMLGAFLLALTAMFLPVSLRDVPRMATLSSDPDQHAFFAFQIQHFGLIPWDQGLTGIGPFNYPAGFAALNAVWMAFSGISAVDMVTIQPLIQFLLAGALWVSVAPLLLHRAPGYRESSTDMVVLVTLLATVSLYWFVSPYGLQEGRSLGQGAGRLSVSCFALISILLWIAAPVTRQSVAASRACIIGAIVSLSLVAAINPLSAVCPAFFTAALVAEQRVRGARVSYRFLGLVILGGISFLACDPYFAKKVIYGIGTLLSRSESAPGVSNGILGGRPSILFVVQSIIQNIEAPSFQKVPAMLLGNRYAPGTASTGIGSFLLIGFLAGLIFGGSLVRRYVLVCVFIVLSAGIKLDVGVLSSSEFPAYLIQPYLTDALEQIGLILGVGLLVWVTATMLFRTAYGSLVVMLVVCGVALVAKSPALRNPNYDMSPRVANCGPMGCISRGDAAALEFISALSSDILKRYPDLNYVSAPKMMILNNPAYVGDERWLFPPGASRLVPLFWRLPTAFFYGQGSRAWTYNNYIANVCDQFDIEWLRKRNVRYLFAVDGMPGCLSNKDALSSQLKVIFERDGTRVFELF